jgi:hypothetical protein
MHASTLRAPFVRSEARRQDTNVFTVVPPRTSVEDEESQEYERHSRRLALRAVNGRLPSSTLCLSASSLGPVPVDARLLALYDKRLNQLGADDILPEFLLLKQLEVLEGRAGVGQVLEVRRLAPVLQVLEVLDESGIREQLLRCQVVEIERVGERLNKLREATGERLHVLQGTCHGGMCGSVVCIDSGREGLKQQ